MSRKKPPVAEATAAPAPPSPLTKLEAGLADLAATLLEDAKGLPADEKVGVFKAVSAYYASLRKLPPPPEEGKRPNAFEQVAGLKDRGSGGNDGSHGDGGASGPGKF